MGARAAPRRGAGRGSAATAAEPPARVIVNAVAPDVVRLTPPFVITPEQTARALEVLCDAIEAAVTAAGEGTP